MDLKSQQELNGIILDCDRTQRGLLNESIDIVNLFVDKGEEIVTTKERLKIGQKHMYQKTPIDKTTPLVILINSTSAL